VKPINRALGEVAVWRMTPAQVVSYIREREIGGLSNATINRELDIIRGVLKRAKRWHHFSEDIHPLPVRQNIGRRSPTKRRSSSCTGQRLDLSGRPSPMPHGTNNDTKVSPPSIPLPHVIDSLVELSGIEPLTSSLRTRRSPS
jgi:hypothetical protein